MRTSRPRPIKIIYYGATKHRPVIRRSATTGLPAALAAIYRRIGEGERFGYVEILSQHGLVKATVLGGKGKTYVVNF